METPSLIQWEKSVFQRAMKLVTTRMVKEMLWLLTSMFQKKLQNNQLLQVHLNRKSRVNLSLKNQANLSQKNQAKS